MIRNLPSQVAAGYTDSKGLFAPRKAVVHYSQEKQHRRRDGRRRLPRQRRVELIVMSMNALLNDGDEILLPAPDYPLYTAGVALSGGTPVHYICDEQSGWLPDIDDIRKKITPNTKGIVVINPNNPTGALYPVEVLQQIVEVARQHQLIVFADEIYDKTLYDGETHTSIASLADDVLFVTYNGPVEELPLLRLPRRLDGGVGREAARQGLHRGAEHARLDAAVRQHAGQLAIQTALGGYQSIKDLVAPTGRLGRPARSRVQALERDPGRQRRQAKAALYMFPKLDPKLYPIDDDQQFAYELLAEEKVLIVQGTGFNWIAPTTSASSSCRTPTTSPRRSGRIARFLEHYRKRHPTERHDHHETHPSRPAGHRHRRQRHLQRAASQPGRDPPPRRRGIEITMVADLDTARARSVVGDKARVVADAREVIANPRSTSSSS
jgi:alanine-synthesizing transaminase